MATVTTMPGVGVVLVVGARVVMARSGQRVGDLPAVRGDRLSVRGGLSARMSATVTRVVRVFGRVAGAGAWARPTVVVAR